MQKPAGVNWIVIYLKAYDGYLLIIPPDHSFLLGIYLLSFKTIVPKQEIRDGVLLDYIHNECIFYNLLYLVF